MFIKYKRIALVYYARREILQYYFLVYDIEPFH